MHCDKIFADREEAKKYLFEEKGIEKRRPALYGEPMVMRYGDLDEPNILLAIGSVGDGVTTGQTNKVYFIDIAEINEVVDALDKKTTFDVEDSDTIDFTLNKSADGMVLSADLRLCKGITYEDHTHIDNQLSATTDGLMMNVDIFYNEEESSLSLIVNNETVKKVQLPEEDYIVTEGNHYSTDDESIHLYTNTGRELVIPMHQALDEWTVLTPEDTNTPIVLTRTRNKGNNSPSDWHSLLSADVRIFDDVTINNILKKTSNGKYLYVDGKASNITYVDKYAKYSDTPNSSMSVQDALDKAKTNVAQLESNIISLKTSGVYANVDVSYDKSTNTLFFKKSNVDGETVTSSFELASMSIAEKISYDSTTNEIIIYYTTGSNEIKVLRIPLTEVFKEFTVDNSNSTITLDYRYSDIVGSNTLKGNVNISTLNDNILINQGHSLYVKGTADNIAYQETNVKLALDALREDLRNEVSSRGDKDSDLEVVLLDTKTKLESEIKRSADYDEALSAYSHNLSVALAEEIVNRGLSEHLIDDTIKTVSGSLETYISKVEKDSNDVDDELKDALKSLSDSLDTEIENRKEGDNSLNSGIQKVSSDLEALSNKTVTSVTLDPISDLLYMLRVNGEDVSEVTIPKDNYLEGVTYDNANKSLVLTYVVNGVKETKSVNISALSDVYAGSEAILINDDKSISLKLSDHKKYLTIDESGLNTEGIDLAIESAKTAVSKEVADLAERVSSNENTIGVINGNEAQEGSIKKALDDAKKYTDRLGSDITSGIDAINGNINTLTSNLSQEITNRIEGDSRLNELINTVDTKTKENKKDIGDLQTLTSTLVSGVTIHKENDLEYSLFVNGLRVEGSNINIPKDQFLKDVTYNQANKSLDFTFKTLTSENNLVSVKVDDLVDTYTAGDGLNETNNKFSIKVSNFTEPYLSVGESGLMLSGINEVFDTKADVAVVNTISSTLTKTIGDLASLSANTYTKTESDYNFLSEVELKTTENPLKYVLMADGKNCGEFTIPTDKYLSNVVISREASGDVLTFTFADESKKVMPLYSFGDGIKRDGTTNKLSVVKAIDSEPYLVVDENGVKVTGISELVTTSTNATLTSAKTYTDRVANDIEDKIANVSDVVSSHTLTLNLLTANEATDGSISNAIKKSSEETLSSSKTYTDSEIAKVNTTISTLSNGNTEVSSKVDQLVSDTSSISRSLTTVSTKVDNLESNLNILKESTNASVSALTNDMSLLKQSTNTLDGKISALEAADKTFETRVDNITTTLTSVADNASNALTKANANEGNIANLNTKVGILEDDIEDLDVAVAQNTNNITNLRDKTVEIENKLNASSDKITTLETKVESNSNNISTISGDIKTLTSDLNSEKSKVVDLIANKPKFNNTNTITFAVNNPMSGGVSANVVLATTSDNTLTATDVNGLYVKNSKLTYDTVSNTLKFVDNKGVEESFVLNSVDTLKDVQLDGVTDEIVFKFDIADETTGEPKSIRIPLSKFFKGVLGSEATSKHNIQLDAVVSGATTLYGNVDVDLLISKTQSTVTLSKVSANDNTLKASVNISDSEGNLLTITDNALFVSNDATKLKLSGATLDSVISNTVNDLTDKITTEISNVNSNIDSKVNGINKSIDDLEDAIEKIDDNVDSNTNRIVALETKLEISQKTVVENRERITRLEEEKKALEAKISELKNIISGQNTSLNEVTEKLEYLMKAVTLYDASDNDEGVFEFVKPDENVSGFTGIKFLLYNTDLDYNSPGF